jgi:hypothetical protein
MRKGGREGRKQRRRRGCFALTGGWHLRGVHPLSLSLPHSVPFPLLPLLPPFPTHPNTDRQGEMDSLLVLFYFFRLDLERHIQNLIYGK